MTQTTESKQVVCMNFPVFVKQGKEYLDHLWQGGLVEKTIWVRYYPQTGRVECEVKNER